MSQYPPVYPPFYPLLDPPPPPMPEQLLVNGVDLGSYAYMTTDVSSLFRTPPLRGEDLVLPGQHGRIDTGGDRFDANEVVLPLWVVGCQPDGTVPGGGMEREFYRRKDELLRLFYGDSPTLTFRRPDGVELSTRVKVADVMDWTRRYAEPLALVTVALRLLDAFWTENADASHTITGVTGTPGTLTEFVGATAPITDAVITFHGPVNNPQLNIGERWVRYNGVIASGRSLVLECKHWRASAGPGASWEPDERQVYRYPGPSWLEIPPSFAPWTTTFTHTGGGSATAEIAGHRKFLSI